MAAAAGQQDGGDEARRGRVVAADGPYLAAWPEGRELWRRPWLVFCLTLILGEEACADGEQAQVR